MSFKIIMTTSVTRPCFTTHQTCKTKTKTDFFWSETGLVLRPTFSDHITGFWGGVSRSGAIARKAKTKEDVYTLFIHTNNWSANWCFPVYLGMQELSTLDTMTIGAIKYKIQAIWCDVQSYQDKISVAVWVR